MEIAVHTPRRLELKTPSSIWSSSAMVLFGLLFFGCGAWSMFAGKLKVLKCQRLELNQIECQLSSTGLIGRKVTQIGNLERAEIAKHRSRNNTNRGHRYKNTYSVVLIAKEPGQKLAISSISSSDRREEQAKVNQINAFINNPQQFIFQMREDGRWLGYLIGSVFMLVGGSILVLLWRVQYVDSAIFDKNLGVARIQKRSILGKTQKLSWNLKRIKELSVEQKLRESKKGSYIVHTLYLEFNSPQDPSLKLLDTHDATQAETLAGEIRRFFGFVDR